MIGAHAMKKFFYYLHALCYLLNWPIQFLFSFYQNTLFLFYKDGPTPASFSFIFVFLNTLQFLHQINVKIFHPVYGAGIRTHDLWNRSVLPKSLDQGFRPDTIYYRLLLKCSKDVLLQIDAAYLDGV